MTKPLDPSTPQFKTALVRRIKNIAPDLVVEFCEAKRGAAFRLRDAQGRYRSRVVTIHVNRGHALDRSEIEQRLNAAGYPGVVRA